MTYFIFGNNTEGSIKRFAESVNRFLREEIKSGDLKFVKKYTSNVEEFSDRGGSARGGKKDKKKMSQKDKNLFRIADMFALRRKEDVWLLYQEELFKGAFAEDIFWKLVWQVKILLLVKSGGGSELHPFVYGKAKKAASLFKEAELTRYSGELTDLYHRARQGFCDFNIGLEKFILKI